MFAVRIHSLLKYTSKHLIKWTFPNPSLIWHKVLSKEYPAPHSDNKTITKQNNNNKTQNNNNNKKKTTKKKQNKKTKTN